MVLTSTPESISYCNELPQIVSDPWLIYRKYPIKRFATYFEQLPLPK